MSHFWRFVHHCIAHPLMGFPVEPSWAEKFHEYSDHKLAEALTREGKPL